MQNCPFLFIFDLFSLQFQKYKFKKVYMVCWGFKPGAKGI